MITLMSHIPPRTEKQYTIQWMVRVKTYDFIVTQLLIKSAQRDAPFVLRNLPKILDLELS